MIDSKIKSTDPAELLWTKIDQNLKFKLYTKIEEMRETYCKLYAEHSALKVSCNLRNNKSGVTWYCYCQYIENMFIFSSTKSLH